MSTRGSTEQAAHSGERPPKLGRRFVESARHWREAPTFINAMSAERNRWNEDYPLFRIRRNGTPMPDRPWQPGQPFLFPPALQVAQDGWNHRLSRDPKLRDDMVVEVAAASAMAE